MEIPQDTLPYYPEVSVWIIEMEGRKDFLVLETVPMGVRRHLLHSSPSFLPCWVELMLAQRVSQFPPRH